jgi:hypothetical protein
MAWENSDVSDSLEEEREDEAKKGKKADRRLLLRYLASGATNGIASLHF